MLNNTNTYNNTNLKIQACSGGIYKSHNKSWFERFHLTSKLAERLLCKDPIREWNYNTIDVVVLQMVICGDMQVIAEIIKKEDYENIE
jgi:hypothetical protein